ncbi:putative auxin-induced protein X15-like [Capsicum annuum]|nr:putative auxin-induced protein X15-like [Capsicum annuum]
MARRWQKFAAMQGKRMSLTRNGSDADSCSTSLPSIVRKGHFVMYTTDQTHFVIPLDYLENEIIIQLLILSEEEFGLPSAGPIIVLCDSSFKKGLAAGDLHKAFIISIPSCCCSSDKFQIISLVSQYKHRFRYQIGVILVLVVLVVGVAASGRGIQSGSLSQGNHSRFTGSSRQSWCPRHVMAEGWLVTLPGHLYAILRRSEVEASYALITDMIHFDVILRIDWLSPDHVVLYYFSKTVSLALPGVPLVVWQVSIRYVIMGIISYIRASRLILRGCESCLAYVWDVIAESSSLDSIPVVQEFPDVLLTGLPDLAP